MDAEGAELIAFGLGLRGAGYEARFRPDILSMRAINRTKPECSKDNTITKTHVSVVKVSFDVKRNMILLY